MASDPTSSDLIIRGESVQRVFQFYRDDKYVVNRRYQRKLVWTVEEKEAFIDSLIRGYPVPLILLAETQFRGQRRFEILDGMQRLNAVTSFVEGDFALNGSYFDLNTMAQTKLLMDEGALTQGTPLLSREQCVALANYQLPFSTYPAAEPPDGNDRVDEIFRRINSYGKHLSRQEIRTVGATGNFAELVRQLSCRARGDVSASDLLLLSRMKEISISNKKLSYGLDVESIFWVSEGIVSRSDLRESKDEELVAEVLACMAIGEAPGSHAKVLDDYFGYEGDSGNKGKQSERYNDIESAVQKKTPEVLEREFLIVFEELRKLCAQSEARFNVLVAGSGNPAPRYFQVVFLAMYELIIEKELVVADPAKLLAAFKGLNRNLDLGGGGSWWKAEKRQHSVKITKGLIQDHFRAKRGEDAALVASWVTQFENLLTQSFTEQSLYDFKQGLWSLDAAPKFDGDVLSKVVKTLTAMANSEPGSVGYVVIGVADSAQTAARVEAIHGVKLIAFNRFWVTGIEHESTTFGKGLDGYFQNVLQRLKAEPIPDWASAQIGRDVRMIRYFDKAVLILTVKAGDQPMSYADKFYERSGPNVVEVPVDAYRGLFARFKV
jgi:hypothetical protein